MFFYIHILRKSEMACRKHFRWNFYRVLHILPYWGQDWIYINRLAQNLFWLKHKTRLIISLIVLIKFLNFHNPALILSLTRCLYTNLAVIGLGPPVDCHIRQVVLWHTDTLIGGRGLKAIQGFGEEEVQLSTSLW